MTDYLKLADEAAAAEQHIPVTYFGTYNPYPRELLQRLEQAVRELVEANDRLRDRLDAPCKGCGL